MAAAVGQSEAKKILLPMSGRCNTIVAGVSEQSFSDMISSAVALILKNI
jgi:hypothetical protein